MSSRSAVGKIVAGMIVNFDALIATHSSNPQKTRIALEHLINSSMGRLISVDPVVYDAQLVRSFFEQKEGVSKKDREFTVTLQGKQVTVSPSSLSEHLGLSGEGAVVGELDFSEELGMFWRKMKADGEGEFPGYSSWGYKNLKEEYAWLYNILTKVVECRTGSWDRGTKGRWNLMVAILTAVEINWSQFLYERLLEEMTKPGPNKGYGIILHILFERMGLNVQGGEPIVKSRYLGDWTQRRGMAEVGGGPRREMPEAVKKRKKTSSTAEASPASRKKRTRQEERKNLREKTRDVVSPSSVSEPLDLTSEAMEPGTVAEEGPQETTRQTPGGAEGEVVIVTDEDSPAMEVRGSEGVEGESAARFEEAQRFRALMMGKQR